MSRYFVPWCLDDDVEKVIDAFEKHGQVVEPRKVFRHLATGMVAGSAEVILKDEKENERG